MGLKPIVKQVCPIPNCDFAFKYHVKDQRMHPDMWVMTAASREHLATAHTAKPKLYIVKSITEEPRLAA